MIAARRPQYRKALITNPALATAMGFRNPSLRASGCMARGGSSRRLIANAAAAVRSFYGKRRGLIVVLNYFKLRM